MSTSVLFDAPGPKARGRHRLYSVVTALLLLAALAWVVWKLDDAGQFESRIFERLFADNVFNALLDGLQRTLVAAGISIVTSVVLGLLLAFARLSDHAAVRWPATVVVEFFRAVPLLLMIVVLFFFYVSNLELERETAALAGLVSGLTLYNGSVLCEVFRAGVNAVPRGQSEAAYAVGMRKTQVMTTVLVPQAVRVMLPAIISQCVVVLKDTSLGYLITYAELIRQAKSIATYVGSSLMTYLLVALIYIAINSALSFVTIRFERRLSRSKRVTTAALEQVEEAAADPMRTGA
jgi:glutamate transport system permease protein